MAEPFTDALHRGALLRQQGDHAGNERLPRAAAAGIAENSRGAMGGERGGNDDGRTDTLLLEQIGNLLGHLEQAGLRRHRDRPIRACALTEPYFRQYTIEVHPRFRWPRRNFRRAQAPR